MGFGSEIIVPLLSGGVFGFALDKGRVDVPFAIASQMEMSNFVMMRMFLTASGCATVCISVLHNMDLYDRCPKPATALGFNAMNGYGANVLGGILLGSGMYLAGTCPGTIWAQIGAIHTMSQAYVFAGALTGTITFGYLRHHIKTLLPEFQDKKDVPFTDEPSHVNLLGLVFLGTVAGGIAVLEGVFPWKQQLAAVMESYTGAKVFGDEAVNPLTAAAWDPLIAGLVVGLLQIASVLSMGNSFGSSGGWVYLASKIMGTVDSDMENNSPYLHSARKSVIGSWQFIMGIGAIMGGLASQLACSESTAIGTPISGARAFCGGFIMLVGARLGGGCTSGHGLSGIATGSLASIVSVACMFIGGMGTALVLNPTALLQSLHLQ